GPRPGTPPRARQRDIRTARRVPRRRRNRAWRRPTRSRRTPMHSAALAIPSFLTGHGITHLVDGALDAFLDLAGRLVDLAFTLQLVVVGECAGCFLDATFRFVD